MAKQGEKVLLIDADAQATETATGFINEHQRVEIDLVKSLAAYRLTALAQTAKSLM